MQFINFGTGADGVYTVSSPTTDAPIDSSCSGTSGTNSLTATNASFASGQQILIHQSRGTGVGQWEVNFIVSYTTGTITTLYPLVYTYADSGASQAQCLVIKQYSGVTISDTLTAKTWDGDVGGIVALSCMGTLTVTGSLTAGGKGYRGADTWSIGSNAAGKNGEGTMGNAQTAAGAQGNGAGAAGYPSKFPGYSMGGSGGSHATVGTVGSGDGDSTGEIGSTVGSADLITSIFGGGGSGGSSNNTSGTAGAGGFGGGLIFIFSTTINVSGSISANGGTGGNSGASIGGGGGGAGGGVLIKTRSSIIGTNLITATRGAGGTASDSPYDYRRGGVGGLGRIRIETCSLIGTTNPTVSSQTGGYSYCGGNAFLF